MSHHRRSQLIFGCHSLATLSRRSEAIRLVRKAWNLGIDQFDTAPLYSCGYSEILLGQFSHYDPGIRLTTKIGTYPNPKTILPAYIAMPLNAMRGHRSSQRNANPGDFHSSNHHSSWTDESVQSALQASLMRLQAKQLDAYLLHEINPFEISECCSESLLRLQHLGRIQRIGYGGVFREELLCRPLPRWLSVLQLPFSFQDQNWLRMLREWLQVNPDKEVRLFGLFRDGVNPSIIHRAKLMLDQYPNLKLLFSCRSVERLESNLQGLLGE